LQRQKTVAAVWCLCYEETCPLKRRGSRRLPPRSTAAESDRKRGLSHWRRQGGPAPPPNRRAKNFLVQREGLLSLPPAKSGRACYDNPTGSGHFYQMPNMYTCIAYLFEIRKFCSKNLVHKGVNFEAQNALKHLRAPLI